MKGILFSKKKRIHSDWTLMTSHFDGDTFRLRFADKLSDDAIALELEPEDVERLANSLKKKN